jgi:hypothetical protein
MKPGLDTSWEREPGGHLSDAGVEAAADGQPISVEATTHAEACEACSQRLADAALRAVAIGGALRELAEEPAAAVVVTGRAAPTRPRSAIPYIAIALAIALVASIPSIGTLPAQVAGIAASTKLQIGGARQVGGAVLAELSAPASSLGLAALLIAVGAGIAVWGSKREERRRSHGLA